MEFTFAVIFLLWFRHLCCWALQERKQHKKAKFSAQLEMDHAYAVWESVCSETGVITPYSAENTAKLEVQFTELKYRGSARLSVTARTINLTEGANHRIAVDVGEMIEHSAVYTNRPPKAVVRRLSFQHSPRLMCALEFTVLETQRLIPLYGFGKIRLPTDRPAWANLNGKYAATTDNLTSMLSVGALQGRFAWEDDWTLAIHSDETDGEGWQYAIDYPQTFHPQKEALDFVRRRRWIRSAHTVVSLTTGSDLALPKEIQAFVTRMKFSPCQKDLDTLKALETSLLVTTSLNESLELAIRETICRDEISNIEEHVYHMLHSWANADRVDICHSLQSNAKQLFSAQSDLLDKWTSKRGPRQSGIFVRVVSAENVPIRFGATHKLRVGVKFLATDLEVFSDTQFLSATPIFDFPAFSVVPDDTKPIIVTLEAVAHGVAELVTAPIALGVAPLNLRGKYSSQEIDSASLVYRERGALTINCLDERGINATATNIRVEWSVEPRELSEIEFCDHCGSMTRLCSCTQDEIDAREKAQALKEAQRQAEIYAARAKRLAKQRAEDEEKNKERREQQKRACENDQRLFVASELDPRTAVARTEAVERATMTQLATENIKAIAAAARKKELLRVVFKIRIDQLHDARVAMALEHFLLLQQYAHRRREEREHQAALDSIKAALSAAERNEKDHRMAIDKDYSQETKQLTAFEKDQRPLTPIVATSPDSSKLVVSASDEDKQAVQANFKKEMESKSSCCSVM